MSFTATFYTFRKRINSCKLPGTGTDITVELKQETDILNPVLILNYSSPYAWNYCYIAQFSRYYWVNNWKWVNGLWEAWLSVDVLASYRTDILASSQYVSRSYSTYDGTIKDTLYPVKNEVTHYSAQITSSDRPSIQSYVSNGCYVVGIIGNGTQATTGTVNYYVFTQAQFRQFKDALLGSISWTSVSDISTDLLKTIFNPYQYIVSCKYFPIAASSLTVTSVSTIYLGWWSFTCPEYIIYPSAYSTVFDFIWYIPSSSMPEHPQAGAIGSFLNGPEYSEFYLSIPPYGVFKLPCDASLTGTGIAIREIWDLISGEALAYLYYADNAAGTSFDLGTPITCVKGVIGVDMQLAQVRSNGGLIGTAASVIGGGISTLVDNTGLDGVIKNAVSGIGNAMKEEFATVTTSGSNGSFAALVQNVGLMFIGLKAYRIAEDNDTIFGRPLCSTRMISTLSGYCQCVKAHVTIAGTDTEEEQIENYMNSGFFIE